MTKEQLIAAIAEFTGLEVIDTPKSRSLSLYSPNGRLVCMMSIFENGAEGWVFGGIGGGFPDDWKTLCHLHEGVE